ncbi:rhamnan synthesis F family protein [Thiomonas sp. FB-Cd]|uniref:rhamnan synthesis F family protein n=1 Tax=Thiomonas sp. FB-Cd TaxID=1158292 RepID=UPI00068CD090|nr:rhamnan synthesis F family protein [Thiomonas sp. FB-Cd]
MQTDIEQPLEGRTLVVVLGMHRSGTSALAACLNAMGMWAGEEEDLLGATPENARGYWELRALVEFNDALLAALGCAWDASRIPPVARIGARRFGEFAQRAQELLCAAFGAERALVIKDPRMCRLLDFWIPQFEQAGLSVRYVLTLRDPLECALSILRRDRLPLERARWLWADHLVSACNQTAGRDRLFVSYAQLLRDPTGQLHRLAAFLGLKPSAVDARVVAVVEPALRHQIQDLNTVAGAADSPTDATLGQVDRRVYDALLPRSSGADLQTQHAEHGWSLVRQEVHRLRAGHSHTDLDTSPRGGIAPVKTAVMLHLYYPEQWPQVVALLEQLWPDIDLFVSVAGPHAEHAKVLVEAYEPKARVFKLPNQGRDLAAFLHVLPALIQEGYACVCKLHTKRSDYAQIDGQGWRLDLWGGLLGRAEETERIRARFGIDQALGLLGLQDYWVAEQDYRDSCHDRVVELARRLLPDGSLDNWHFFAGTMFWFRPQALVPLLTLGLGASDFEPEQGQREGTLAHAIERVLPLAVRGGGYGVALMTAPPLRRQDAEGPVAFARTASDQLLDELRQVRERLVVTEAALADAQKLALERMAHAETLEAALADVQSLARERIAHAEALEAALAQAQHLALERLAYIDEFHHSLPGRVAQVLRRIKS